MEMLDFLERPSNLLAIFVISKNSRRCFFSSYLVLNGSCKMKIDTAKLTSGNCENSQHYQKVANCLMIENA